MSVQEQSAFPVSGPLASAGGQRPAARHPRAAYLRLAHLLRWREWYASKLPFVWTALAAAGLGSPLGSRRLLACAAMTILFVCLCGAFGHLANDHADRACDRAAGKRSSVAELPPRAAVALLVAFAAAALGALGALCVAGGSLAAFAPGLATLILAAAYSLPPLRLKERGALGVWSAAAAQRTLPVLTAFAALAGLDLAALAFAAVAQLAGMRWMLVHQLADAANDRHAGVDTYVARAGEARARLWLPLLIAAELAAITAALWTASASTPHVWWIAAAGALAAAGWAALPHGPRRAYALEGFDRQPLAGFYQFVWPLGAAILLTLLQPGTWPLAAAFLLWEAAYAAATAKKVLRLLRTRAPA